ncbi:uncharacterized protein LOC119647598 isoform X1 [Hermetia illucens]|uniref:uncharacterized protein LOC119647598 isoform X1 n=2 Tax=Hermetia illucens TaxID=343691 RepID=UPI0018CC09B2|nr:uncharacterized protein LOC119647598 isoform X1 [Hermetia illucens]
MIERVSQMCCTCRDVSMEQPYIVQAEYSFRGDNNDELCFKKGDIITVTQREEGGWWEGTLGDKTGWFPSNYVKEYKASLPLSETIRPPEEIQEYRSVVFKDLLESERAHVAEIRGLLENFLEPLGSSQLLTPDEYSQLMCNFVEVVETHEELLKGLEECNDRVGKLFLTKAPLMKSIHQAYCAAHPRAIVILDRYKVNLSTFLLLQLLHRNELESFMERQGAASPGLLVLTTGLSKPFRRLDKYSAMLQELERHMESSHPDRGDTQRSVAVYKDIAATCSATRRQKELELQVLTGPVRGWQGQELSTLGDIIHMGSVAVGPDHRDRYFVLFPQTLVILSVSQRMSAFIYEGKLPLTGIIVNRLEDTENYKNAFEISGQCIERIVAVCQGPNEANKWVELLSSINSSVPINIKRNISASAINTPQPPLHSSTHLLDSRGYCTRFSLCAYNLQQSPCFAVTLPPRHYPAAAPYAALTEYFKKLVRQGVLRRFIVKALLYPESIRNISSTGSVTYRQKKATAHLEYNKSGSSDRSRLSRQDAFEIPSDSGSDIESCDSSPFGYIKFYTGKKSLDRDTEYETFIDYGSDCDLVDRRKQQTHRSSLEIKNLNRFEENPGNGKAQKDSMIIGSKAVRALEKKGSSGESMKIHTSTARLNIGQLKEQFSEQSNLPSFGGGISCNYVACENLADMDDEAAIKKTTEEAPVPDERRSMPTLFVGNRFNNSSMTEVYIPSWKDKNEMQMQSMDQDTSSMSVLNPDDEDEEEEYLNDASLATHSSSIDLPALVPAPDQLSAELLYNFPSNDNVNQEYDFDTIIPPPAMFKNSADEAASRRLSLRRDPTVPFGNHSLNSDKRIVSKSDKRSSDETNNSSPNNNPQSAVRRCISYQYLRLGTNPESNNQPDNERKRKPGHCKCCESSQCPSPRSSDSGMAGSCTIASPDPPTVAEEAVYYAPESESEDIRGRTSDRRVSRLQHSQSSHNLQRYGVCGTFRNKFLTSPQSHDDTRNSRAYSGRSRSAERTVHVNTKRIMIGFADSVDNDEHVAEELENGGMFKTGLYAHWWKKEKLPNALLREIAYGFRKPSSPNCRSSRIKERTVAEAQDDSASSSSSGWRRGSDVAAREFRSRHGVTASATVTTQTESVVQSPSQLQSISQSSTTTTSSTSSSATPTKSTATSSRPQIKFSPDIELIKTGDGKSSGSGAKRKDRKHKS